MCMLYACVNSAHKIDLVLNGPNKMMGKDIQNSSNHARDCMVGHF